MAGKPVHVEIPAHDTQQARDFWGSLFGWQFEAFEGSPTEYHTTQFDEQTGGAIYVPEGESQGLRVYFDVDDINGASARVRELGGEMDDAMPVPGMGHFSIGKDPGGNEFGLWQHDLSASMPE